MSKKLHGGAFKKGNDARRCRHLRPARAGQTFARSRLDSTSPRHRRQSAAGPHRHWPTHLLWDDGVTTTQEPPTSPPTSASEPDPAAGQIRQPATATLSQNRPKTRTLSTRTKKGGCHPAQTRRRGQAEREGCHPIPNSPERVAGPNPRNPSIRPQPPRSASHRHRTAEEASRSRPGADPRGDEHLHGRRGAATPPWPPKRSRRSKVRSASQPLHRGEERGANPFESPEMRAAASSRWNYRAV